MTFTKQRPYKNKIPLITETNKCLLKKSRYVDYLNKQKAMKL